MAEAPQGTSVRGNLREVRGDVGAAGGHIHHDGDLKVHGNIRSGMKVDITGDLLVGGNIESADVKAAKSIVVVGAMAGHGHGHCISGGAVSFRQGSDMRILAADNVTATLEIDSCRVISGGAVLCEQGRLHGGHITANGGIACGELGSSTGEATLVEAGFDERERWLGETHAEEVERNLAKVHKIRTEIAPLLANKKGLTPRQMNKCTAMLFDAGDLEEKTEALMRELRRVVKAIQASAKSEIIVNKTLYPGVTLRFSGVETVTAEEIAGPLRIWIKPIAHFSQIVITKLADNTTLLLKTSPYIDENLAAVQRTMAGSKVAPPKRRWESASA